MAFTYVGSSTNDLNSTSESMTKPAGVAEGDVLLVGMISKQTPTFPAGWELKNSYAASGGTFRLYAKVATASEGSSYTVTFATTPEGVSVLIAIRPPTPVVVVSSVNYATSTDTLQCSELSAGSGCAAVCFFCTSASSWGGVTPPSGYTEVQDNDYYDGSSDYYVTEGCYKLSCSATEAPVATIGAARTHTYAALAVLVPRSGSGFFFGSNF